MDAATKDLEHMATATAMDDATLLAHVRTMANLHDGSLAKWVLGVAAERIEKRAKETEDLNALRRLVTWWTNWPGGILVGQVNDNTWQAACQHPKLLGVAFHGPTPRFALEQARIALTTDGK